MQVDVRDNIAQVLAKMDSYKRDVVDKAASRALNRTAEMAGTRFSRDARSQGYNFSASEIKAAMRFMRASQGRLVAGIKIKRRTKSLMEFNPRESKQGVSVKVVGQRKMIKGAFIAQRLNGRQGVFIEDRAAGKIVVRRSKQYKKGSKGGWQAYPCKKLYGPSVGGAAANERMQALMQEAIRTIFPERMKHEVKQLSR